MTITDYITAAAALLFVVALMGLLVFILRKINGVKDALAGRTQRLHVVEQRMIDNRHKMALIRRDDVEHLVILSQDSSQIVETEIPAKGQTIPTPNKKDVKVESF